MFRTFVKNFSGATSIEYGLIAASVSIAIVTAVALVGSDLTAMFGSVSGAL